MKYFYTDPLAAAWMAKHFGMKFENGDNFKSACEVAGATLDTMPFVIQRRSVRLLEPQQGDWIKADELTGGIVSDVSKENKEAVVYFDGYCIVPRFDEIEIVQRNDIAFMWPQKDG